jgi:hypothetical protein
MNGFGGQVVPLLLSLLTAELLAPFLAALQAVNEVREKLSMAAFVPDPSSSISRRLSVVGA